MTLTGINIQAPWAELLVLGLKSVETRSYPLPNKLEGEELAVIETPGKSRKFKARIVGTVVFSHSFQYKNENDWKLDFDRHKVDSDSKLYGWNDKPKYGWVVSKFQKFENPINPPSKRGIIYTKGCLI